MSIYHLHDRPRKTEYLDQHLLSVGFTLIELLIVIVIISTLALVTFVALNPAKRLQDSRNVKRLNDIDSLMTAMHAYTIDNGGLYPAGLTTNMAETQLGTCATGVAPAISTGGCNIPAGKACVDLSSPLSKYLKSIPIDPKYGTAAQTGYSVSVDANNIISVNACGTEGTIVTTATPVPPTSTSPSSSPTPTSVPTPTTDPGTISFFGGWDQGYLLGSNEWSQGQWVNTNRFQLVTSPVRKGTYSVRVEVDPGDVLYGGERSEVATMKDGSGNPMYENTNSGTQYYALSVYLPTTWQPPLGTQSGGRWGVVFQLHGPDVYSASPTFELEALDRFTVYTTVGDLDYCGIDTTKCLKQYNEFSDGSLNLGKWNDFVIAIKFAKTYTGSVDVWRRVEGQTTFNHVLSLINVPTLQYKTSVDGGVVGDHYWKTGFYRSSETFTSVLWVDGPVRGDSFNAVVAAAFP